ncbi:hypothetical protein AB0I54_00175 [Streptomyces sp. NPDC050625]|uniref:hypothetical protein n=1 Tax=Streptomyces sp. NPDC050625 TaxID=3154629 RepID=UPI0034128CCA
MTEITTAPETRMRRLLRLAAASRQAVELEWEREKRERIDAQRQMAERVASDDTYGTFPDTLAQVIHVDDWSGYPALFVDEAGEEWAIAPCAVTYLDEGIWLHYVVVAEPWDFPEPRWTLIAPCVCGSYREVPVSDDYALARELEHLTGHRDVCFGDCRPNGLAPSAAQLAELTCGQEGAAR